MTESTERKSLFASLTDREAEALIRLTLGNADFPEMDFTDAINLAIDVCMREAAKMLDRGDTRISERTQQSIALRRSQGQL